MHCTVAVHFKTEFCVLFGYKITKSIVWALSDGSVQVSSVQSFSCVWLFVTPWTEACQASVCITNSWSLFKFMSIELVMPFNHLILWRYGNFEWYRLYGQVYTVSGYECASESGTGKIKKVINNSGTDCGFMFPIIRKKKESPFAYYSNIFIIKKMNGRNENQTFRNQIPGAFFFFFFFFFYLIAAAWIPAKK